MTRVVRLVAVLAVGAVAGWGVPADDATRAIDAFDELRTQPPANRSHHVRNAARSPPCDASLRPFATQPAAGGDARRHPRRDRVHG